MKRYLLLFICFLLVGCQNADTDIGIIEADMTGKISAIDQQNNSLTLQTKEGLEEIIQIVIPYHLYNVVDQIEENIPTPTTQPFEIGMEIELYYGFNFETEENELNSIIIRKK